MCNPTPYENHYDDDMQKAIGLLFIAASNAEAMIGMQVARCMCFPHTMTIQSVQMCMGMDFSLKLKQIEIGVRLLFPQHLAKIEKITSSIRRQFDHRNALAHNSNYGTGAQISEILLKMTSKGFTRPKVFNANQITNFSRIIHERCYQLDRCLNEIGFPKII